MNYYSELRILRNGVVGTRRFRNDSWTAMNEVAGVSKRFPILAWGLCAVALGGMASGFLMQTTAVHR